MWQLILSENSDANIVVLAKIFAVASWLGAVFVVAFVSMGESW